MRPVELARPEVSFRPPERRGAWHDRSVMSTDGMALRPRRAPRRLVNPTVALVLAILIINLSGLVALAVRGEAPGHDILAIVGLCNVTAAATAVLRSLRDSAVPLGLVTLVVLIWPDPIFAAARLVAPAEGQAVGEAFTIILATLCFIIIGVANARRLLQGD